MKLVWLSQLRGHRWTGPRCVCRGRVGMTQHRQTGGVCEIPGQQHRVQAPKGRAFWGGNAINMKTPHILARQGEASWVLKATFGKCPTGNKELQHVNATCPHHLPPL